MDTEVFFEISNINFIIGNEVADFVRDHLINELKSLASFKAGNYEQALKDIYLRMDEMLKTSYGK